MKRPTSRTSSLAPKEVDRAVYLEPVFSDETEARHRETKEELGRWLTGTEARSGKETELLVYSGGAGSYSLDLPLDKNNVDYTIEYLTSRQGELPERVFSTLMAALQESQARKSPEATREASADAPAVQHHAGPALPPVAELPANTPKLYVDRPRGQNIISFLRDPEGWGPYIGTGLLTRVELGRRDPQAYKALENWLRSNTLPSDVVIPKKSEVIDRMAQQYPTAAARPAHIVWAQQARRRRGTAGPT